MKPIESKRVALDRKIVLRFPDFDGFVTEFAANLSMTGMFVRSRDPQEPGTPVAFELRLEDGAPLVRGSGWVVWSRKRNEAQDRPAGMGIEFTELDHKSRRLVRWMILNQLPEGAKPYEVRPQEAPGLGVPRGASRDRSGRNWRVPVVAGLLFVALAALILRGNESARRAVDEPATVRLPGGGTTPSQASKDAARSPGSESASGEQAAGRDSADPAVEKPSPASKGLGADGVGDDDQAESFAAAAIEEAVRSWARAWSDQDANRYLEHYASAFEPAGGLSRRQWTDQRRQRVMAPESIRVAVTRLETTIVSANEARVSFLQTYRSDGYADTVDKVLDFVREDGRWKIRRETAD